MSATGRGAVRMPDDFYCTPPGVVDAILPHLPMGERVLDAGCGDGAILKRLVAGGYTLPMGIELDEERASASLKIDGGGAVLHGDFLTYGFDGGFDLVIMNPPFSLAMDFVLRAIELTRARRGTVAALLRVGWIGSIERAKFHREHPSDLYVLEGRPEFVASLKCKGRKETKTTPSLPDCGWKLTQRLDAERPTVCPACGLGQVSVTTTDNCDYGWFCFRPAIRVGKWQPLAWHREAA